MKEKRKERKDWFLNSDKVGLTGVSGTATLPDHRPATLQRRKLQEAMQKVAPSSGFPDPLSVGIEKPRLMALQRKATTRLEPRSLQRPYPQGPITSPVVQLAIDNKKDFEKLGWVYDGLKSDKGNVYSNRDDLRSLIQVMFSWEVGSPYQVKDGDFHLMDHRFYSQRLNKAMKDSEEVRKPYDQLSDNEKEDRIAKNKKYFKEGDYFIIRKPNDKGFNERMVLNILSQKTAINLLKYIADGWDEGKTDWRNHVEVAKVLGISNKGKVENSENELKYDKVVIYYQRKYRQAIQQGVKGQVTAHERVDNLPAFYNVLEPGMAIGEERGGPSFTHHRAIALTNWILKMEEKGLKVTKMSKNEFIEQAHKLILADLEKD